MAPPSNPSRPTQQQQHPLYNNGIFTAHRVSPLYLGSTSSSRQQGTSTSTSSNTNKASSTSTPIRSEDVLSLHARRFEEILRGDVVRGVHVGSYLGEGAAGDASGSGKEATGREGALVACSWRGYDGAVEEERMKRAKGANQKQTCQKGIHVQVQYEKAVYHAFLLRDDGPSAEDEVVGKQHRRSEM